MSKNIAYSAKLNSIVETFILKRKYNPAIQDLLKIQEEYGNEDDILYYLGLCYSNTHEYEKAADCLDFVCESGELSIIQRIQANMLLGLIYTELEDLTKAEKALKDALEINPGSSMSFSALGYVYYLSKRYDLAIYNFKRALQIDPNNASAHNNLGYTYVEIGINLSEAVTECRKALALNPKSPAYRDSLGWAHFSLENYTDAVREMESALQLLTEMKGAISEKQFKTTSKLINEHLSAAVKRRDKHKK